MMAKKSAPTTESELESVLLKTMLRYSVDRLPPVVKGPVRGPIPADLGLALIQGPSLYVFMEPRAGGKGSEGSKGLKGLTAPLPVLVMLGDVHVPEYCKLSCTAPAKCVSAQDRTPSPTAFLAHLNARYGPAYAPDLFVEVWDSRAARRGDAPRTEHRPPGASPMLNLAYSALPCAYPDKVALVDGDVVRCPYPALRVHVVDVRVDHGRETLPLTALAFGLSAQWFVDEMRANFPECAPALVVASALDNNPCKYFGDGGNPFCGAYSRVTHELRQLAPGVFERLRAAVAARVRAAGLAPPLFDADTLEAIQSWVSGGVSGTGVTARLAPDILARIALYDREYGSQPVGSMSVDLYAIARALKVTRDGRASSLCVFDFGTAHIESIATLLSAAGLYDLKAHVRDGLRGSASHRCIVLDQSVRLVEGRAAPRTPRHVYSGPVVPWSFPAHEFVRTGPWP